MRWLICVPAWGAQYTDVFRMAGLPALERAAAALPAEDSVALILYSDVHDWPGFVAVVRTPPPAETWDGTMSAAHREVMAEAGHGDAVVLMTADMVVSDNALAACRRRFLEDDKRLVCAFSIRAIVERWQAAPPDDTGSRALAHWGWDNRHDLARAVTWPDGHSADLSRMYFERDGNVAARAWLPHPLALLKDGREVPFGPTIDCDLTRNFALGEIHYVESPDEAAVVDLSPADKFVLSREDFLARGNGCTMAEVLARQHLAHDVYRHLLTFRVSLVGDPVDCGDAEAVRQIVTYHTRSSA